MVAKDHREFSERKGRSRVVLKGLGGDGGAGGFWLNPRGSGGAGMNFGVVCTSGKASKKILTTPRRREKKKGKRRRKVRGKKKEGGKGEQLLNPPKKSVRGWKRGTKTPEIPKAGMEEEIPWGG